ncbi:terpenoid cyclases/protein prenyltransferase alpha-alpha toroid [Hysterangium stoloniferum]|nr:terpenoid cyclases/protein prenyltransferase alpha-alpha toroid [Hysterangium stoloniferum]
MLAVPPSTVFAKEAHAGHLIRCITGLPGSKADLDTSRLGIAYYCLSGLDLLGVLDGNKKVKEADRREWRDWIWSLSVQRGEMFGWRSGTSLASEVENKFSCDTEETSARRYDPPHLIMTYTALLSLTILRDDFMQLDRIGLKIFLQSTQHPDGSFSPLPLGTVASESDLRLTFCVFAICSMLDDWTSIDVAKAVAFILQCRTYEGGYGESPGCEAQGGPTYCALSSLRLLPKGYQNDIMLPHRLLPDAQIKQTVRWLIQRQKGGFQGRTEKTPDACYCFWCGASLKILESDIYVNNDCNAEFLLSCQFKYGGIAKSPGEAPDPYHTYLSLASLSLYPPTRSWLEERKGDKSTWQLNQLDPVLNLRIESAEWARKTISGLGGVP